MHTDQIDHLATMIGVLDHRIEEVTDPFAEQLKLLQSIPGIGERGRAGDHLRDRPRTWPGSPSPLRNLASWAGLWSRGTTNPAGKTHKTGRTRKGNAEVRTILTGVRLVRRSHRHLRRRAVPPACTAGSARWAVGRPPSRSPTPSS